MDGATYLAPSYRVQTSPFIPCLKHPLAMHWSTLKCSVPADRYLRILPHLPVLENFLSAVPEGGPANHCLSSSSQGYHWNQGPEARHLFFNHLRLPLFGEWRETHVLKPWGIWYLPDTRQLRMSQIILQNDLFLTFPYQSSWADHLHWLRFGEIKFYTLFLSPLNSPCRDVFPFIGVDHKDQPFYWKYSKSCHTLLIREEIKQRKNKRNWYFALQHTKPQVSLLQKRIWPGVMIISVSSNLFIHC